MKKTLLVMAVIAAGAQTTLACPGERLLATPAPALRMTVRHGDDFGTNGRLWQSRPLVRNGPAAMDTGNPGAEAYGAHGEEEQWVWVRVGATAVAISPWRAFTTDGMQTFEHARRQWLAENGYTGGVRTFRKVAYPAPENQVRVSTVAPQPRATIRVPDGARTKRGFHVDSGGARDGAARLAALRAGAQPVRISWPMNAPVAARAMTDATGGYLLSAAKIQVARSEP